MTMKKTFAYIAFALALVGCQKSLEYKDVIFLSGAEYSPAQDMYIEGPTSKTIKVKSSDIVKENIDVYVQVDPSQVAAYNKANGTDLVMLPEGSYAIMASNTQEDGTVVKTVTDHFTIPSGVAESIPLSFEITTLDEFEPGVSYCAPVTITKTSTGAEILKSSATIILVVKTITVSDCVNLNNSTWFNIEDMWNNPDLNNLSAVTMEARVYANGWRTSGHHISSIVGIEEHMIVRFGDGSIDPSQIQIAGRGSNCTSADKFNLKQWYHVVAVDDGSKLTLYVDGKEQGSIDSSSKATLNLGAKAEGGGFRIGASAGDNRTFNGWISEVRVWKRAVPIAEAEANQCILNPDTAQDLVGYWRMNELNADGKLVDLSGNNFHGTPNNTVNWVEGIRCPIVE